MTLTQKPSPRRPLFASRSVSPYLIFLLLNLVLVFLVAHASATTITVQVLAHETSCYYLMVDEPGKKKIAFYFSVQSGGDFDIDYSVSDPEFNLVIQGEKERQIDIAFRAERKGEYSFCFSNSMSTFDKKIVDMELSLEGEHETRPMMPAPTIDKNSHQLPNTKTTEEIIFRISSEINSYHRTLKYYHTREARSFDTAKSTERRIWWFSLFESCLIVLMSVTQVYVVKNFFKGYSGKGRI